MNIVLKTHCEQTSNLPSQGLEFNTFILQNFSFTSCSGTVKFLDISQKDVQTFKPQMQLQIYFQQPAQDKKKQADLLPSQYQLAAIQQLHAEFELRRLYLEQFAQSNIVNLSGESIYT